jgi:iron-sulfur cluster repair protein YtfE (RIC family)
LTQVSAQHDQRILAHLDLLPGLAEEVGRKPWADVEVRLAAEHDFLVSTLLPHIERVEAAVHPELDSLMSCRLGMAPLEREHKEIRKYVAETGELLASLAGREPTVGEVVELNRVLLELFWTLKLHIREERLYLPILERNLSREQAEAIAMAMEHPSGPEV